MTLARMIWHELISLFLSPMAIARALGADPVKLFKDYVAAKGSPQAASKRPTKRPLLRNP